MSDELQLVVEPVPSLHEFFLSETTISLVVGPVGSTKTSAGIQKIAYHASRMARGSDGVRRSRCVWVRNTKEQLRDSSIPDLLKWYRDGVAGTFFKTEYRFVLRFDDVECEILFRGLDDADDVRRLLSVQASFGVLEEFREIHKDIYEALQGRLGRYPDGMMVPHRPEWGVDEKGHPIQGCVTDEGKSNKHLWGMSNPPDMDTFWEETLTNPPDNVHVTIQPSGLSPEADWLHLLPSNYYEDLAIGKTDEYKDVYIHAEFGKSLSGRPVHRSFSRDLHVGKLLTPSNTAGLMLGADAGRTPAAIIGQVDYTGRLLVYHALAAKDKSAMRFIREDLIPLLTNRFGGSKPKVCIDPAAFTRGQADERTVADIYRAHGFKVVPAPGNNRLAARMSAVDSMLTRLVDGKPITLIDEEHCQPLIQALAGKYRYRLRKDGSAEDEPEKSHPWSDLGDAFQYLCLAAGGGVESGVVSQTRARTVERASTTGWT